VSINNALLWRKQAKFMWSVEGIGTTRK